MLCFYDCDCHIRASSCRKRMKISIFVPSRLFFFDTSFESFLPFETQKMPFKTLIGRKERPARVFQRKLIRKSSSEKGMCYEQ